MDGVNPPFFPKSEPCVSGFLCTKQTRQTLKLRLLKKQTRKMYIFFCSVLHFLSLVRSLLSATSNLEANRKKTFFHIAFVLIRLTFAFVASND